MGEKVAQSFYAGENPILLARNMLGMLLCTHIDGCLCKGMIVETEAYFGVNDKASHAYGGRRTTRTETMFAAPGTAYIYLCYGMHHLFNVVTGPENIPHAVLIRALEPLEGEDYMIRRRGLKMEIPRPPLCSGPGSMSKALGITRSWDSTDLLGPDIWLEKHLNIQDENCIASTRVGVGYAGEDARHPWRFRIKNNPWCSKAK